MKLITPSQIRAGRAFLDWSQKDLGGRCGVSVQTIANIENNIHSPSQETQKNIVAAFKEAGLSLIGTSGLISGNSCIKVYAEKEGLMEFMDDVYETIRLHGGKVRVTGVNESKFRTALTDEFAKAHIERIMKIDSVQYNILTSQKDAQTAPYGNSKPLPDDFFTPVPCYIYFNKVANISWNPIQVIVIENADITSAYAKQFDYIWQNIPNG